MGSKIPVEWKKHEEKRAAELAEIRRAAGIPEPKPADTGRGFLTENIRHG